MDVRTAAANSTLCSFREPVLSTMLAKCDAGPGAPATAVLQASRATTFYVLNQSSCNENPPAGCTAAGAVVLAGGAPVPAV